MDFDRDHLPLIQRFIDLIESRSDTFAAHAGVGGVETLGHLVGYLADNPQDLEPFLVGGFSELPDNWLRRHSLTFHCLDGKVRDHDEAHRANVVARLAKLTPEGDSHV